MLITVWVCQSHKDGRHAELKSTNCCVCSVVFQSVLLNMSLERFEIERCLYFERLVLLICMSLGWIINTKYILLVENILADDEWDCDVWSLFKRYWAVNCYIALIVSLYHSQWIGKWHFTSRVAGNHAGCDVMKRRKITFRHYWFLFDSKWQGNKPLVLLTSV